MRVAQVKREKQALHVEDNAFCPLGNLSKVVFVS